MQSPASIASAASVAAAWLVRLVAAVEALGRLAIDRQLTRAILPARAPVAPVTEPRASVSCASPRPSVQVRMVPNPVEAALPDEYLHADSC